MTDRLTRAFADLAHRFGVVDLDDDVVHETRRRLVDAVACGVAGIAEAPCRAVRRYVARCGASGRASVWGTTGHSTPELAALANGTAIRCLDYNDTYLGVELLHPSDTIAALLALAEAYERPVDDLLVAVATAYEAGVLLCEHASLKARGWDHVNYITIATVVGGARLAGLSPAATEEALGIATVPHAAMRKGRAGELTMWKAATAANAARHAVFALELAACGMRGPDAPFEGTMGFNAQLLGGGLDVGAVVDTVAACRRPARIRETALKTWPVEYMAQAGVAAALEARGRLGDPGEGARIEAVTFGLAYDLLAADEPKWRPATRETADHSLPYLLYVAVRDGEVTLDAFRPERIAETAGRLEEVCRVEVDEALDRRYPAETPVRVTIHGADGRSATAECGVPPGHVRHPLTDRQLDEKFHEATGPRLDEETRTELLALLRGRTRVAGAPALAAALRAALAYADS